MKLTEQTDIQLFDRIKGANRRNGKITLIRYDDEEMIIDIMWSNEEISESIHLHRCYNVEWIGRGKKPQDYDLIYG